MCFPTALLLSMAGKRDFYQSLLWYLLSSTHLVPLTWGLPSNKCKGQELPTPALSHVLSSHERAVLCGYGTKGCLLQCSLGAASGSPIHPILTIPRNTCSEGIGICGGHQWGRPSDFESLSLTTTFLEPPHLASQVLEGIRGLPAIILAPLTPNGMATEEAGKGFCW